MDDFGYLSGNISYLNRVLNACTKCGIYCKFGEIYISLGSINQVIKCDMSIAHDQSQKINKNTLLNCYKTTRRASSESFDHQWIHPRYMFICVLTCGLYSASNESIA